MYHIKVHLENPDIVWHEGNGPAEKYPVKRINNTLEFDVEPGHSLLEALLLHNIHLSHNCGGVCACTTSHIYVHGGDENLEPITDREEDYVDRARNPTLESRLGCQSILLPGSGAIEITIPDQTDIIGHEH